MTLRIDKMLCSIGLSAVGRAMVLCTAGVCLAATTIGPARTTAAQVPTLTPPPAAAPAAAAAPQDTPASAAAAQTPATSQSTQPAPVPLPPPQPNNQCYPACRPGFLCAEGQCISECNPPCPADQICSNGECELPNSAAPPPPVGPTTPAHGPPPSAGLPQPPAPAPAQTYGDRRYFVGAEEHDGFMLRLALGMGFGQATFGTFDQELDLSGLSASFSLDIGGEIAPNFNLHGRLASASLPSPSMSIDGRRVSSNTNTNISASVLGIGATYYVMPINLYITGVFGLSHILLSDDFRRRRSNAGWALNLDVGKEWWVSDDWGLGVAGRFWLTRVAEEASDDDLTLAVFAVLFSATYQ